MNRQRSFGWIGILLALVALPASAARVDVSGTITQNATWTGDNVYVMTGDVSVAAGVTLTIQPGTVVKGGWGSLWVNGTVLAEGTSSAPIAFTSYRDDTRGGDTNGDGGATSPAPGNWRGLIFQAGSRGRIVHASVSYGGCGGYCYGLGTVETHTSDLVLQSVLLERSLKDGLYADGVSPTLSGCTIQNNTEFGLRFIGLDGAVPLSVTGCVFTSSGWNGGLLTFEGQTAPPITFRGNRSSDGKCGFSLRGTSGGDLTWDNGADLPLLLYMDTAFGASATLTLMPGTVVKGQSDGLFVDGFLFAEGTETAPISLTSYYDDSKGGDTNADGAATSPTPGNWKGVHFRAGSHGRISSASVSYGGGAGYSPAYGCVQTWSSGLELDHVTLERSSKAGLYANHASPVVKNCAILNNAQWALQFVGLDPSFPLAVTDNTITSTGYNGGFLDADGQAFAPATFRGNRSTDGRCGFSVRGVLNGDLTWDNGDDLPLLLYEDTTVAASKTLTLMPGTVVKASTRGLWVGGALLAEGTSAAPIAFTSYRDDSRGGDTNADGTSYPPEPGNWRAVTFNAGSQGRIANASLSYGGGWVYWPAAGALQSWSSSVSLESVTFEKSSSAGIYGNNAGIRADRCSFLSNQSGARHESSQLWIDARYCWWGDASGPYHPTKNPTGKGQAVSDWVLFFPWAEDPSGTVMGVTLLVGGAKRLSPGQTTDYTVSYANWSELAIENAVLVAYLPAASAFVESTGGGSYRWERHEVYWKLGTLAPGAEGVVSVRVTYAWGLTQGRPHTVMARLAGTNFGQEQMDVAEYLAYEPMVLTGSLPITEAEFAAERAACPDLEVLYSRAIAQGYQYQSAAHLTVSTAGAVTQAILFLPDRTAILALHRQGSAALAVGLTRAAASVEDATGGVEIDLQTLSMVYSGTWVDSLLPEALTAKCRRMACFKNCMTTWVTAGLGLGATSGLLTRLWGTFTTAASSLVLPAIIVYGVVAEGKCIYDCENDQNSHCCTNSTSTPSFDALGWQFCRVRHCTSTGEFKEYIGELWACASGRCRGTLNEGEHPCDSCGGSSRGRLASDAAADCLLCEFVPAKDPNAKYGPAGDVLPGQTMDYTLECENVGEGRAYGVYIVDKLPETLETGVLSIQNGGALNAGARTITWSVGELGPKGDPDSKAQVTFSGPLKPGLPSGTSVINQATVYFPSVPEETPTNPVVNVVQPVTAAPKSVETIAGIPVSVTLSGTEVLGAPLVFRVVDGPSYGSLTGASPNLVYAPVSGYVGPDLFHYTASNGTMESGPAPVTITVGVNPADATPPAVAWTNPASGEILEVLSKDPVYSDDLGPVYEPGVLAAFAEPLDPSSVAPGGLVVTQSGSGRVANGTVLYQEGPGQLLFTPREAWQTGTYSARVLSGLRDLVGNTMAADHTWNFTLNLPAPPLPGDCDGNGAVSIGEVQKAINMYLGILAPGCGVDCNASGTISVGEVQKVINAYLGMASSC